MPVGCGQKATANAKNRSAEKLATDDAQGDTKRGLSHNISRRNRSETAPCGRVNRKTRRQAARASHAGCSSVVQPASEGTVGTHAEAPPVEGGRILPDGGQGQSDAVRDALIDIVTQAGG